MAIQILGIGQYQVFENNIVELTIKDGCELDRAALLAVYREIAQSLQNQPFYLLINRVDRSFSYQFDALTELGNHPQLSACAIYISQDDNSGMMSERYLSQFAQSNHTPYQICHDRMACISWLKSQHPKQILMDNQAVPIVTK